MLKKSLLLLTLIAVALFSLTACGEKYTTGEEYGLLISPEIPRSEYTATFTFDDSDISETVAYADYIFVGEVTAYVDTLHESEIPMTEYKVRVIEAMKGEPDEEITIFKNGGLAKDYESKIVLKYDTLPLEGETYIFTVQIAPNSGRYLVQGEKSTLAVDGNYSDDDNYKQIMDILSGE